MERSSKTYKTVLLLFLLLGLSCVESCSKNTGEPFPESFNELTESEKIEWLVESMSPDSLARLICNHVADIDSLIVIKNSPDFIRKVYTSYSDSARIRFGEEFNRYVSSFPPRQKMKVYKRIVTDNPAKLGIMYAEDFVENSTDPSIVYNELVALKEICGNDSTYYYKFLEGMNSVNKNSIKISR